MAPPAANQARATRRSVSGAPGCHPAPIGRAWHLVSQGGQARPLGCNLCATETNCSLRTVGVPGAVPPMEWRAARPAAGGNGPLGGPVARETSQTKAPGVQWDGRWHPIADVGRLSPETVTRGGRLASITAR